MEFLLLNHCITSPDVWLVKTVFFRQEMKEIKSTNHNDGNHPLILHIIYVTLSTCRVPLWPETGRWGERRRTATPIS